MSITVSCPRCGCRQIAPDHFAGIEIDCPGCSRALTCPPFDGWPTEVAASAPTSAPTPRSMDAYRESPVAVSTVNTEVHVHTSPDRDYLGDKSPSTAAMLEIVFGVMFSVYGIGHIYSGNVATGLLVMVLWWGILAGLLVVGILSCGVGFFAIPACLIATAALSATTAANACRYR